MLRIFWNKRICKNTFWHFSIYLLKLKVFFYVLLLITGQCCLCLFLGSGFESHWVPYWRACTPCNFSYDVIAKLGTFQKRNITFKLYCSSEGTQKISVFLMVGPQMGSWGSPLNHYEKILSKKNMVQTISH